jgi:dihydrofolate synthase / folylpolyglutamate synthase
MQSDPLDWLYSTQLYGIKLGLENVRRLLDALDLPAREQRFIHVAGTNGKGSTCAFMHSILREAGVRAGLFTSPHLIRFNERIRDQEREITDAEIDAGLCKLRDLCRDWDPHPTFFELTFALAMDWFRQRELPWVILEVGMGGRLDATNAITPAVSVITPIGMDHVPMLGNTLAEIAGEKAGIIKPGVPVVSAPQKSEAQEVIETAARARSATLCTVKTPCDHPLGLAGPHQRWNAAVAVAALEQAGFSFSEVTLRSGLRHAEWPGRFQMLDAEGRTLLDGAHNEPAAEALVAAWREKFPGEKATVIFGGSSGKDTAAILKCLAPIARRWIFTDFKSPRALSFSELKKNQPASITDADVSYAPDIATALLHASAFPEPRLITGSLFFAGEVLAYLSGSTDQVGRSAQ